VAAVLANLLNHLPAVLLLLPAAAAGGPAIALAMLIGVNAGPNREPGDRRRCSPRMTLMRRMALLLVPFVLIPAGVARAGGWATVELGETPSGIVAGTPQRMELIVKQHGITPMEGVHPSVRLANAAGDVRTFTARPTGRVGVYVVDVTFPSAGTWRARLFDGFTDAVPHRIPALTVGTGPLPPDGFPVTQALMIAIVALLFLGGWIAAGDTVPARDRRLARGRRRPTPRAVA
jgi:hypothetical protein